MSLYQVEVRRRHVSASRTRRAAAHKAAAARLPDCAVEGLCRATTPPGGTRCSTAPLRTYHPPGGWVAASFGLCLQGGGRLPAPRRGPSPSASLRRRGAAGAALARRGAPAFVGIQAVCAPGRAFAGQPRGGLSRRVVRRLAGGPRAVAAAHLGAPFLRTRRP